MSNYIFMVIFEWNLKICFHLYFVLSLQSWDAFFRNANAGVPPGAAYQSPLALQGSPLTLPSVQKLTSTKPNVEKLVADHLAVQSLIRGYQVKLHFFFFFPCCIFFCCF